MAADARVWCWGFNVAGQLGRGTASMSEGVAGDAGAIPDGVVALGLGSFTTCFSDGLYRVHCLGGNQYGQLGDGMVDVGGSMPSLAPVQVVRIDGMGALDGARQIEVGDHHVCAILGAEGGLACWGEAGRGRLGVATLDPTMIYPWPQEVSLVGVLQIAVGESHTCAVAGAGALSCWGDNDYGQAGAGAASMPEPSPVAVELRETAVDVAAGKEHTCARLTGGGVWCWGRNNLGQLGDGAMADSTMPVEVISTGVADLSVGQGLHTCVILGDGEVQCWGSNEFGQVGQDLTMAHVDVPTLVVPPVR